MYLRKGLGEFMPIYQFECQGCGCVFEKLRKKTKRTWQQEEMVRYKCPVCEHITAKKLASGFRIGTGALETTGRTGYETDELTLGKIVDNDGKIPYEYKDGIRKRSNSLEQQKEYTKGLIKRGKKYNFNPFGDEE